MPVWSPSPVTYRSMAYRPHPCIRRGHPNMPSDTRLSGKEPHFFVDFSTLSVAFRSGRDLSDHPSLEKRLGRGIH